MHCECQLTASSEISC